MADGSDFESRYEFICCVGQGGYGKVYKAWDNRARRTVALKGVRTTGGSDGIPKSVVSEVCTLRRLSRMLDTKGERICELLDVVRGADDVSYIIYEYCEHDLDGLLYKGMRNNMEEAPIKLDMIRHYVNEILEALVHMHKCGFVHRDLKPDNVLVTQQNHIKLADFGLSRKLALEHDGLDMARMTSDLGTLYYKPCEFILGMGYYDEKSDIWSMGCLLYELCANEKLFDGTCEVDHWARMLKMRGRPEESWMKAAQLPGAVALLQNFKGPVGSHDRFREDVLNKILEKHGDEFDDSVCEKMRDLIVNMVAWDPAARPSAAEAIETLTGMFDDLDDESIVGPLLCEEVHQRRAHEVAIGRGGSSIVSIDDAEMAGPNSE